MKCIVSVCVIAILISSGPLARAGFDIREFDAQGEYADSRPDGIRIDPDGRLSLSGRLEEIWTHDEDPVCWTLAAGPDSAIYAATADDGKVYRWAGGKMDLLFDAPQVMLFSLLPMKTGDILAGAAPDGIIYRIPQTGQAEIFTRTDTHYIWDIAMEPGGTLLAATGLPARVYRLDSSGNVINTVDVPAEHVRAIAVGPDGRVWLGTAGTGKMYELSGTDLSMVIDTFSAEISALAPGSHGVWFSTVAAPVVMGSGNNRAENMNPRSRADDSLDEKGSLWFMDYTGRAPREVWETRSAPIFDLVVINDKPVMACGDDGSIIQLDDDRRVTLLTTLPERQIVCLETDASGTLWAGAAGTAAVFKYTDRRRGTGSLESPVLDAGYFARWGRMLLRGRDLEDTTLALETRSGNSDEPGEEWSDWIAPGENRSILSPPARYFQWRLTLTRTERLNPVVDTVAVSRLTVNQPPYITRLKVFPVTRGQFIERPGRGKTYQQVMKDGIRIEYALPNSATNGFTEGDWMALRGMRTVAWDSGDPDNEPLEFQIEIASNNPAPVWLLLENAYPDPIFSFDSSAFPDGDYVIRVTASDAPAHPAGRNLTTVRTSRIFEIDNTPPVISALSGKRRRNDTGTWDVHITGIARDGRSRIDRLEYSFDTEEWFHFTSTDDMLDGIEESFDVWVTTAAGQPAPETVFVKVTDAHENVTTSTVTVDE